MPESVDRHVIASGASWEAIRRDPGGVLGAIRPVTSMLQVSALTDPAMLVAIEADAIIHD